MRLNKEFIGLIGVGLLCGQLTAGAAGEQRISDPLGERSAEAKKASQALAQTCRAAEGQAPTMVAIRPGRFQMGSMEGETNEQPPHAVTIPQPFAISRCEITVGQFRQFVQDTNYQTTAERDDKGCHVWNKENSWEQQPEHHWKNPGFKQNDAHPVVCVSWDDAQEYVQWLSRRTGAAYRLPTEAEWEYVARVGTTTARYYQDGKQCEFANGLGQEAKSIADPSWMLAECNDGQVYTAPAGSFGENYFGLFDMLGNAWEWVEDCWHDDYQNAPKDGSAWLEKGGGDCDHRVVRGGSWNNDPQYLRSAFRVRLNTGSALISTGFRIARAL